MITHILWSKPSVHWFHGLELWVCLEFLDCLVCISAMKSEAVQAAVLVSLVIDGKKALATMPSYTAHMCHRQLLETWSGIDCDGCRYVDKIHTICAAPHIVSEIHKTFKNFPSFPKCEQTWGVGLYKSKVLERLLGWISKKSFFLCQYSFCQEIIWTCCF